MKTRDTALWAYSQATYLHWYLLPDIKHQINHIHLISNNAQEYNQRKSAYWDDSFCNKKPNARNCMRYVKLLPANKDERKNLMDILTVWKHTIAEYKENYTVKNWGSYTLWKDAIDRMIMELQSDRSSVHCFLLLNESDDLQAIAICTEASKSEILISDFLVAPWNIKNEIFTLNDILSEDVDFNEEQLIKFILYHYSSTNYSEIIYIPDYHRIDVKTVLFDKLKFEPYYKYLSRVGIGINGYKVSKGNLMEYRSSLFENKGITFFSAFTTANLLDNYPEMENEAGDSIFKLHVK